MKVLNNFISRIGSDKILHYLVGAWLIALAQPYGAMVFTVFLILSLYKEYRLDTEPDLVDVAYYVGGSLTSAISYIISLLICCYDRYGYNNYRCYRTTNYFN